MPTLGGIIDEIKEEEETQPGSFDKVRQKYLTELAEHTGNGTIIYSSGWTELNANSPHFSMTDSDVNGFMQTINDLETDCLDLIIHSPGGSPEAAEQIVTYLRQKFREIRMFVPQMAMSAATLMCCSADEVVMGNHSSLGPTDPQMLIPTNSGQRWVAAQSIIDQFEEVDKKIQSGDSIAHYSPILNQYDPGLLAEAKEAVDLSQSLAKNWAEKYMFSEESDASKKADELGTYLSDRQTFLSHSRRLSRPRLKKETPMNLLSLEDDQELQDKVLSVYHAATATHNYREVAKLIENHHGETYGRQVE